MQTLDALDALIHLSLIWNRIPSKTIKKCFYNRGFPNLDDVPEDEPQAKHGRKLFQNLLKISWQKYVNMDQNIARETDGQCSKVSTDLPDCASSNMEKWDQDPIEIKSASTLQEAARLMKETKNV